MLRRRAAIGLAAVGMLLGSGVATAAPASAAVYYGDVYFHVSCNYGYYPSASYGDAGSAKWVTYLGYTGYWFHYRVQVDTRYGSSQKAPFDGYCNGMSGQARYYKGRHTYTVYASAGYSYYASV